jgi:DNA-directed RNA polymerase specialized sigma24 family protein
MARTLPTEISTSTYEDERNAFILESLEQARPMLRNLASRYRADFDDLYTLAAEVALVRYEKAIATEKPRGYLQKAIRMECLEALGLTNPKGRKQTLSDHYQIVSLNEPLHIDSEQTLEDVVAAIDHIAKEYPQEVYQAIEGLPEKYFVPLCMRYGLLGHPSHTWEDLSQRSGIPMRTVRDRVCKAVELLRERLSEEVLHG